MGSEKENTTLLQRIYSKSCDIAENLGEIAASWEAGQYILKQTDRALWILEKSAEWSVPVSNTVANKQPESNGTFGKAGPLIRPLPWILFLPMLVLLRFVRICLNFGAIFIGMDSVKSVTIVKFLQTRRRRVRAIKFRGLRRMVNRKAASEKNDEVVSWKNTLYNKLSGALCFTYSHNDTSEQIIAKDISPDVSLSEINTETEQEKGKETKRKYAEMEADEENGNLAEVIDKLAEADSDEDPDYVPVDTPSDDDSDDEGEDEDICQKKVLKRPPSHNSIITTEVIREECEESDHESDSSTLSADSNIEANKSIDSLKTKSPVKENKTPENKESDLKTNLGLQVDSINDASDEYFSPLNSISSSPEPKKDIPSSKTDLSEPLNKDRNITVSPKNDDPDATPKVSPEKLYDLESSNKGSPEEKQNVQIDVRISPQKDNFTDFSTKLSPEKDQNSNPNSPEKFGTPTSDVKQATENMITTEQMQVQKNQSLNGSNKSPGKSSLNVNSSTNNYKGHGKKLKHKRKFSNLLNRKKK